MLVVETKASAIPAEPLVLGIGTEPPYTGWPEYGTADGAETSGIGGATERVEKDLKFSK